MNYNTTNQIYGLPQGILYGQNDRVDELNDRIYSRQKPDMPLEPNFDLRPVPTKYALFPVINRRPQYNQRIYPTVNHRVETNFSPATNNGPPYGYMTNIDTETILRNQTVALQHGADQGVYIPSSTSDLYNASVPIPVTRDEKQMFPDLFSKPTFSDKKHPNLQNNKIGANTFFNHTRTQLRNL